LPLVGGRVGGYDRKRYRAAGQGLHRRIGLLGEGRSNGCTYTAVGKGYIVNNIRLLWISLVANGKNFNKICMPLNNRN
jgi:hypothetical protein